MSMSVSHVRLMKSGEVYFASICEFLEGDQKIALLCHRKEIPTSRQNNENEQSLPPKACLGKLQIL